MRDELQKKVDRAIRLIRSGTGGGQVEVSYSGGKDSEVILELAKMAGVDFRAIYKNTSIDPPGTIMHCKSKGVEILPPKMKFFELIEHNGFPTRRARFCCEVLKEYKVMDVAIHGIRRSESRARSERYSASDPIICRFYGSKKNHVSVILPILEWTDEDVAEFIAERGIKCHPLYYDESGKFHIERRLGCMACPMSKKAMIRDFKGHPKLLRQWIKAGWKWWDSHPNAGARKFFRDPYELMVHNIFYDTFEDFKTGRDGGMFDDPLDCKKFLESYFNVSLDGCATSDNKSMGGNEEKDTALSRQ